MTEDKQKRVGVEGSSKVDWLSILPESLLFKVLINLPTKDVVKCSVLSKRWRNLWRYVPALDLDDEDFPNLETFVSFVDAFLGFNSESYLESFKFKYYDGYPDIGVTVRRWINTVVDRRVKHLHVWNHSCSYEDVQMPPNLFTCESLVSLKLVDVDLANPKFVSLPSLKVMNLIRVHIYQYWDLDTLISGCPVLESLFIERNIADDHLDVVRVCSQSLLSFTHICELYPDLDDWHPDRLVVVIDAPRLRYLRLGDYYVASFILNNTGSLVEAYIDVIFNCSFESEFEIDLEKRKMIRSFLEGISCVKDMTITSETLEVIYHYSRCEQLPLFRSLSFLHVIFASYNWEMLPIFLESCPKLKSIVVATADYSEKDYPDRAGINILSGPQRLLPSLEYVDIVRLLKGEAMEMQLLSYFFESSPILKKLFVCFDTEMEREKEYAILQELISIPKLSSSCEGFVLPYD